MIKLVAFTLIYFLAAVNSRHCFCFSAGGDSSAQYDSALESSQNESTLDTSCNKSEEKPVEEKPVEDEHHADNVPTHSVELSVSFFKTKDTVSAAEPIEPEHVLAPTLQPVSLLETVAAEPSAVEEPVPEQLVGQEHAIVQPEAEKQQVAEQTSKVRPTEEPASAAESVSVAKSTVETSSEVPLKTEEATMKAEVTSFQTVCFSSLTCSKVLSTDLDWLCSLLWFWSQPLIDAMCISIAMF